MHQEAVFTDVLNYITFVTLWLLSVITNDLKVTF